MSHTIIPFATGPADAGQVHVSSDDGGTGRFNNGSGGGGDGHSEGIVDFPTELQELTTGDATGHA